MNIPFISYLIDNNMIEEPFAAGNTRHPTQQFIKEATTINPSAGSHPSGSGSSSGGGSSGGSGHHGGGGSSGGGGHHGDRDHRRRHGGRYNDHYGYYDPGSSIYDWYYDSYPLYVPPVVEQVVVAQPAQKEEPKNKHDEMMMQAIVVMLVIFLIYLLVR